MPGRSGAKSGKLVADETLRELFPGIEIDVVDLSRADPLLLRRVFHDAVPLFSAGRAFDDARLHAFHRYQHYRPYLRVERDAVRRALGFDVRRS